MLHIVDVIEDAALQILQKYLGNNAYGNRAVCFNQLRMVAKALAVELLPSVLSEITSAISKAAMTMSVPHTIKTEGDAPCPSKADQGTSKD